MTRERAIFFCESAGCTLEKSNQNDKLNWVTRRVGGRMQRNSIWDRTLESISEAEFLTYIPKPFKP